MRGPQTAFAEIEALAEIMQVDMLVDLELPTHSVIDLDKWETVDGVSGSDNLVNYNLSLCEVD